MAKRPAEIEAMVKIAREQLNVINLIRNASASSVDQQKADEQMGQFREIFSGWTAQELKDLQGSLLQSFDNDMQNAPLRINGNDNPERQKLNKEMRNVFQNLFDVETAVKKEESDVVRVEVVDNEVAQNSEVKPAAPKTVDDSRTLLQKIKAIVDKGVQQISEKAAEVKTNMETKHQIRKAVKEFGGRDPLQIISSNAEKAINKIRGLGERASARIMGLAAKMRPGEAAQEMDIGSPTNFQKNTNAAATLAAKATLDTGHANIADGPLPPPPPEPPVSVTSAELGDLLKGLASDEMPGRAPQVGRFDQQAESDINKNFERVVGEFDTQTQVVEQLQQDVQATAQNFVEKAAALEDFSALDALAPEKGVSASEIDKVAEKVDRVEKPKEKSFDEMMEALDSALEKIDAPKTAEPDAPKSGNDSGASTPRAGH